MIKRKKVGLAFAQQTGSSTRGTRFVLRLVVLVLVLMVCTPGFCLRYELPNSRHQTPGFFSSSFVDDYDAAQIIQTKHIYKYKLNSVNYKTNKGS